MDDPGHFDDIRFRIIQKEQEKLAEQFIQQGEVCLYCGFEAVVEDELKYYEDGVRTCVMRCGACGKAWTAFYGLLGIMTDELREKGRHLIPE